ncbi:nuclear transport factor 2 family protein [Streptomyces sp. NPDC050548]|uniref:nuclear transport factor 2 family protein n=1 Tax=Streptomyces sp. NPDC050548 TaxID=3365629 RepID=UPI0037944A88
MTASVEEVRNREIVRQVYEASFSGDGNAFRAAMHEDFEESVPPTLPWGGVHDADAFFRDVLPKFAAAVDVASIRVVSLSADGDHVAALLSGRSTTGDELWIAEHWILRDEKLWRMRNFYFDTTPLLK